VAGNAGVSALARQAEQFGLVSGLVDATESGIASREARIATLRSRRLTETFIQKGNLLPALFAEDWDESSGEWKMGEGSPVAPSMDDAIQRFDEDVRFVNEDRRTGLVTLRIEWTDRHAVAQWSNDLVALANESLRQRAIEEARRSITFLESELDRTSVLERRQIIYRLIESKTGEIMMANSRPEYAFVVVDPAVVPDADNFERPRRMAIIAIGALVGFIIGLVYASLRWLRTSTTAQP
jgi:uncharacterized protein involved in exopolysaccharide biosynthesis